MLNKKTIVVIFTAILSFITLAVVTSQNKFTSADETTMKISKEIYLQEEKELRLIEELKFRARKEKEERKKILEKTKQEAISEISLLTHLSEDTKSNYINSITNEFSSNNVKTIKEQAIQENSSIETKKAEEEQARLEAEKKASEKQSSSTTVNSPQEYSGTGSVVLSNGNTAGSTGVYAAQRMEQLTGVPASTWEYIIARESGGNPNAYNPSGASGLFQTMPFWGSTATVEDQIATAYRAFAEAQRVFGNGLQPWGM